jgi:hypothetical protein
VTAVIAEFMFVCGRVTDPNLSRERGTVCSPWSDRALVSGTRGQEFKSPQARQNSTVCTLSLH